MQQARLHSGNIHIERLTYPSQTVIARVIAPGRRTVVYSRPLAGPLRIL